ncbi:hypothetical protein OIU80_09130 [Flavobacterium sp. LS1R47]|uniref:Uncharacterized protein n=1 Tax=Flavobacterium frigoritolerans TaxID=2987686 RepID=A0A9X3C6M2_9FLAO|nr:hypothetical protein [Flavobacterium frigoritolerans]MCV9932444.1 hypothetical protein [Flavobacterium frigoritolerans]
MKVLSFLILTIFIGNSCVSQKNIDMSSVEITYSAMSRGYYQKIVVKNKMVSITKSRGEESVTNKIDGAQWARIVSEFKKINLETIPQLKAPTEKRFHDGAAIANLKIIQNGKTYETNGFDNGFPPAEIEKLVTLLVAFTQE